MKKNHIIALFIGLALFSIVMLGTPSYNKNQTDVTSLGNSNSLEGNCLSPIYVPWNSFLGMTNILELINPSSSPTTVTVGIYSISGALVHTKAVSVNAGSQFDLILNGLPGFVSDSYGLVKIEYPNELDGRIAYYKSGVATGYEFAYSVSFSTPLKGITNSGFNTYQPSTNPSDLINPVYNWITLINLSSDSKDFDVESYDQGGTKVASRSFSVAALGRLDVDGGHGLFGANRVGVHRIIPRDLSSPYFAQVVRYGDDGGSSFSFAFPLSFKSGSDDTLYGPITRSLNLEPLSETTWVEVVNVTDKPVQITLSLFASNGKKENHVSTLSPFSQEHFEAGRDILDDTNGMAGHFSVQTNKPNSVIAQSMSYVRDISGHIAGMYGVSGRKSEGVALYGSYNTFLNQKNSLTISNTSATSRKVSINLYTGATASNTLTYDIESKSTIEVPVRNYVPDSNYGRVEVVSDAENSIIADLIRVKPSETNQASLSLGIDYAFPTEVRSQLSCIDNNSANTGTGGSGSSDSSGGAGTNSGDKDNLNSGDNLNNSRTVKLLSPKRSIYDVTPTYAWEATSKSDKYQFRVSFFDKDEALFSAVTSETTFTPNFELERGFTYKYRVRPVDSTSTGAWSAPLLFDVNYVSPVKLLSPSGTIADPTPTYSWTGLKDINKYEISIFEEINNKQVFKKIVNETKYAPDLELDENKKYYFLVRALANNNIPVSYISDRSSFTIISEKSPCDANQFCLALYEVVAQERDKELLNQLSNTKKPVDISQEDFRAGLLRQINSKMMYHIINRLGYGISSTEKYLNLNNPTEIKIKALLLQIARSMEKPSDFIPDAINESIAKKFFIPYTSPGVENLLGAKGFNPINITPASLMKQLNTVTKDRETGLAECSDKRDNDSDGLADSKDPSCSRKYICSTGQEDASCITSNKNLLNQRSGKYGLQFRLLLNAFSSQWEDESGIIRDKQVSPNYILHEFFFNHFNVDYSKTLATSVLGQGGYEPMIYDNMHKTFLELLSSVITHPVMLRYLDNHANRFVPSVKAASNQNLGRELVELHTLGKASDTNWNGSILYTQKDIEGSASILAGINMQNGLDEQEVFKFGYRVNVNRITPDYICEDGKSVETIPQVMGRKFPLGDLGSYSKIEDLGCKRAVQAKLLANEKKVQDRLDIFLKFLSNHNRTKENICGKLTDLFVTRKIEPSGQPDDPNTIRDESIVEVSRSEVVNKCKAAWGEDGDLNEMYKAILLSTEMWSFDNIGKKRKNPLELLISAIRLSGMKYTDLKTSEEVQYVGDSMEKMINSLGLPYRKYSAPTGYSLAGTKWINPRYLVKWIQSSNKVINLYEELTSFKAFEHPDKNIVELFSPIMGVDILNPTYEGSVEERCALSKNPNSCAMQALGFGNYEINNNSADNLINTYLSDPEAVAKQNFRGNSNDKNVKVPVYLKSLTTFILSSPGFLNK